MKKTWILVGFMGMLTTTQAMEPEEIYLERVSLRSIELPPAVKPELKLGDHSGWEDMNFDHYFHRCRWDRGGAMVHQNNIIHRYRVEERDRHQQVVNERIREDREFLRNHIQAREEQWRTCVHHLKDEKTQLQTEKAELQQTQAGFAEGIVKLHDGFEKLKNHLRSMGLNDSQIEDILASDQR